jgi:hypothetical protein
MSSVPEYTLNMAHDEGTYLPRDWLGIDLAALIIEIWRVERRR